MQKIDFPFNGFKLTNQPNGTHNLILFVRNDVAASQIHPIIYGASKIILRYSATADYFDLFIDIKDNDTFFELNYHQDEATKAMAYAIDTNTLTEIWIAYENEGKPIVFGLSNIISYE